MQTIVPDITKLGIMDMLAVVLGDHFPEGDGSPDRHVGQQTQRGIIVNPVTRRLIGAGRVMAKHIVELTKEHEKNHMGICSPIELDRLDYDTKISKLICRHELLARLVHQAIHEEHPLTMTNMVFIKEGWCLFDENGEWDEVVAVTDRSSIVCNFITRLTAIVKGDEVPADDNLLLLKPASVGILEDRRRRALLQLSQRIKADLLELARDKILDHIPTESEMAQQEMVLVIYKNLLDLASDILKHDLLDSLTTNSALESRGTRRGWNMVINFVD